MSASLLLLLNHPLGPEQIENARASLGVAEIVEAPAEVSEAWADIPPHLEGLGEWLAPVFRWLDGRSRDGDYVLVQGDVGACFAVARRCLDHGLVPVYATTRREAEEEPLPDGSVRTVRRFKHVRFRRYEEAGEPGNRPGAVRGLDALSVVRTCRLLVTFAARGAGKLPANLGSDLRGTLGLALKETCCSEDCEGDCAYHYLFETRGPEQAGFMGEAPRPFILRPPLSWPDHVSSGEIVTFELVLVGGAAECFPQIAGAVARVGERGLGRDRVPFSLVGISQVHRGLGGRTLFEAGLVVGEIVPEDASRVPPAAEPPAAVTVRLLTPTHVVANGRAVQELPFATLVRALLRRASSLALLHCGAKLELDFRALIDRARGVEVREADLQLERQTRYSAKQGRQVPQAGIVGSVTYAGKPLVELMPLLMLGQRIHVGKGTVFGMGRYVVE